MMSTSLLRAKIIDKGLNYEKCAEYCGISKTTFCKKMKNINKFSIGQAKALSILLQLTEAECIYIFLN